MLDFVQRTFLTQGLSEKTGSPCSCGGISMKYTDYFAFLVDEIHSVIAATVDENGLPVTCAIDIMDWDENGQYLHRRQGIRGIGIREDTQQ